MFGGKISSILSLYPSDSMVERETNGCLNSVKVEFRRWLSSSSWFTPVRQLHPFCVSSDPPSSLASINRWYGTSGPL